jgi:glycosyltransferase involved in cell wall biosynthesis
LAKSKVLITIDWFDPAYKAGGPIMSIVKLIENMKEHYEFYVLTGSVDYGDSEPIQDLETDKWVDWRGLAQVYYLSEKQKSRSKVFEIMDTTEADIYYIQGVFSLYFSIYPLIWWHQAKEDKVIVATRGMFHASALRVKRFKKLLFLYAARIMGWYHHVIFHSTNPDETKHLKMILGNEATYVEASNFPHFIETSGVKRQKQPATLKLLNVARISPEKNTLFLLEVLRRVEGNVELTVVGNYADESYYQQFLKKAKTMPKNVKVHYAGHKPIADLWQYYESHDVFILPTTGENFGHAIIEALSSGMPCIISKNTPWNGLEEALAGYNLEDDVVAYTNAIERYYFMGGRDFEVASECASRFARTSIDVERIKAEYLKLLS